jgi:hypothetical protein
MNNVHEAANIIDLNKKTEYSSRNVSSTGRGRGRGRGRSRGGTGRDGTG